MLKMVLDRDTLHKPPRGPVGDSGDISLPLTQSRHLCPIHSARLSVSEGFLGCAWGTGYWQCTQLAPAPENTQLIWSRTFEVDETGAVGRVPGGEGRDWVSPAGVGEDLVTGVEF